MSSFSVGQIVYVVLNKRNSVQPFRIVEMITKRTMGGEETNYRLQSGPNKSTTLMMDELDGEIFETADDVRRALVERASEQIDRIVDTAMSMSIDWFGSTSAVGEKTIHELPEVKSDLSKSSPDSVQAIKPSPKIVPRPSNDDNTTPVMMPDGSVVRVKLPNI